MYIIKRGTDRERGRERREREVDAKAIAILKKDGEFI